MLCPVFNQECLGINCIGFRTNTKENFKDTQLNRYIPIEDLPYYRTMNQEELDLRFNRVVSIIKECRLLGTLIEKLENIDHLVPNPVQDYYY